MEPRRYLPSKQFAFVASSIVLAGVLIYVADTLTQQQPAHDALTSAQPTSIDDKGWEAALYAIQAQEGSSSLPTPPDQSVVSGLLQGAQSSTVTATVGKTLLVNLANAKAQGLGDDIPTQNALVAQALDQINQSTPAKTYAQSDLSITIDSPATERTYGNALAALLYKYASYDAVDVTLTAISTAADNNSATPLQKLPAIQKMYQSLVQDLLAIPVPQTLSPFHLALINDFSQMAATYPDLEAVVSDPLRGISGMQNYQTLGGEVNSTLQNIAETLSKDDILWSKDEPGALWQSLSSPS